MTQAPAPNSRVGSRTNVCAYLLIGAAAIILAAYSGRSGLPMWKAVVLGIVGGLTEYLPISSTGHLLVMGRLLGLGDGADGTALGTYVIAIQIGAIAAVLSLYQRHVARVARGLIGRDYLGRRLSLTLAIAFVPAALLGALFEPTIKDHLFRPWPVIAAWVVGGIVLLMWRPSPRATSTDVFGVTTRQAVVIGCAQAAALWPGTSRSLVTLIAALAVGLSPSTAIEFSFLLGLATLTAATAWDLVRHGPDLVDAYGVASPLLGASVAFLTAVIAVRWMTTYLQRHSLEAFGYYRLLIAAARSSS